MSNKIKQTKWSKDGLAYHPSSDTVFKQTQNGAELVGTPWDVTPEEWRKIEDGLCEYVQNEQQ